MLDYESVKGKSSEEVFDALLAEYANDPGALEYIKRLMDGRYKDEGQRLRAVMSVIPYQGLIF